MKCPVCGEIEYYMLADGRGKCRHCGKKYLLRPRKSRLSEKMIHDLAKKFWAMEAAGSVAREMQLNPKTVQHYFTVFRRYLAERCEKHRSLRMPGDCSGGIRSEYRRSTGIMVQVLWIVPVEDWVCGLLCHGENTEGEVRLQKRFEPYSLVVQRPRDLKEEAEKWSLDRWEQQKCAKKGPGNARESPSVQKAREFWPFLKSHLGYFRGGYGQNISLIIREMEWRFNRRTDDAAWDEFWDGSQQRWESK